MLVTMSSIDPATVPHICCITMTAGIFGRMYRLVVDRLTHSHHPQLGSYTVANLGYRVYPDADTVAQVRRAFTSVRCKIRD